MLARLGGSTLKASAPQLRSSACAVPAVRNVARNTRQVRAAVAEAEVMVAEEVVVVPEVVGVAGEEPTMPEVLSLLRVLIEETEIAELSLQVGDFELHVKRSSSVGSAAPSFAPPPPPVAAPAPVAVTATAADEGDEMMMTMEETTIVVTSPKVGIFRRGRYAGGKRVGKGNAVNEKDAVKKGQTLGYVEQLGTHVAVQSSQAGEVIKMMIEDGAPVEYGQNVAELAPFFGGHIIGDMKYA